MLRLVLSILQSANEKLAVRKTSKLAVSRGNPSSSTPANAPLGERVYRSICSAIQDGTYRPGDRLREEEIADRLKVSRTPVREAFGRLLTKGFVEPAGARGLLVREMGSAEVVELYALREILEGAAARLASLQASPSEIDDLLDIQQALEAHVDQPNDMARLNRLFHDAIFRSSHNRYLNAALRDMQDFIGLLGVTTFSVSGRPGIALAEHRALIAAIAEHDPDKAEKLARIHIREALRVRMKLLRA
jgi:DNA-binding GntR family transcriptional regulator